MNNQAVVVIPIYKEKVTANELLSLEQCHGILGNDFDIVLVAPKGLNLDFYTQKYPQNQVERLDTSYFKNRDTYSQLLMAKDFYQLFVNYEYMLIYQLDCFVFRNDLAAWCAKGYDYIGAPSFIAQDSDWQNLENWSIGNGGFSLRKISSFLRVLNSNQNFFSFQQYLKLMNSLGANKVKSLLMAFVKSFGFRNRIDWIVEHFEGNEDEFWSKWVYYIAPKFKIPKVEEGLQFGMELNAPFFLQQNNNTLPFGCHAWDKYTPDFWQVHIKKEA